MKAERMTDHQVETQRSLSWIKERQAREEKRDTKAESFVVSGNRDCSEALARFTLSPTPTALLEREINDPKIKKELDGLADKVLKGVGGFLAGRRRALTVTSTLALVATACGPLISPESTSLPSPAEPVITEVAPISPIEPTSTKEAPPIPVTIASGRPYPESDTNFLLGAGGLENAEERLRELGAGPDIDKIWAMGVAEMNRAGINPGNIEWVTELNESAENPSWTTIPKDKLTGHFLFPKITSGSEAGQLVRSGSVFAYLDREIGDDFFDWIELQDTEGIGKVEQRLIGDESGWIVVGAFNTEGEMLFWFNAEEDEWIPASDYVPEVEVPSTEEIKQVLIGQNIEVQIKESDDGSEVAVMQEEWGLDVRSAAWAKGLTSTENAELIIDEDNKTARLIYHEEQILAFSNEKQGAFVIQEGQVMVWQGGEWVQVNLPEEIGEISSFDKHKGEWYGIDAYGRAVVRLNEAGEWVNYERPILIAAAPYYVDIQKEISQEMLLEFKQEDILRLVDDGENEIPYGYLFEKVFYKDEKPTYFHIFVSGYSLGTFYPITSYIGGPSPCWMVFEIPLRYERQIMLFLLPDQTNSFRNLYFIPASRNINERERHPRLFKGVLEALSKPEAIGNQMVLAFQIKKPETHPMNKKYNEAWEKLATALKQQKAVEVDAFLSSSFMWADGSLFGPLQTK